MLRSSCVASAGNGVPVVSYGMLRNRPAYPKRGYRQRLTTWKNNRRCAPNERLRRKPVLTTLSCSLALAQTLRLSSERRVSVSASEQNPE